MTAHTCKLMAYLALQRLELLARLDQRVDFVIANFIVKQDAIHLREYVPNDVVGCAQIRKRKRDAVFDLSLIHI